MKKRIIAMVVCCIMLFGFSTQAFASTPGDVLSEGVIENSNCKEYPIGNYVETRAGNIDYKKEFVDSDTVTRQYIGPAANLMVLYLIALVDFIGLTEDMKFRYLFLFTLEDLV